MKSLGPEGEDIAVKYLKGAVKDILAQLKNPLGVADIIACD